MKKHCKNYGTYDAAGFIIATFYPRFNNPLYKHKHHNPPNTPTPHLKQT